MNNKLNKLFDWFDKNKQVDDKITSLYEYKRQLQILKDKIDPNLDMSGEDIQNINLENLNLTINLREVFVPFNNSIKIGDNILRSIFPIIPGSGEIFLNLSNSRLAGNNVYGNLSKFERKFDDSTVYIWYSEQTFDDNYKSKYPQFFISSAAPKELLDKYYNPQEYQEVVLDPFSYYCDGPNPKFARKTITSFKRHSLTFDEYLEYYDFLKDKYLGNFNISQSDLKKIKAK